MPSRHHIRNSYAVPQIRSGFNQPTQALASPNSVDTNSVGDGANNYASNNCKGDGFKDKQARNTYLNNLSKEQLKTECKKRGQKTKGNRVDLLLRLGVKVQKGGSLPDSSSGETSTKQNQDVMDVSKKTSQKKINGSLTSNSKGPSKKIVHAHSKDRLRAERSKLVLWRSPIRTVKYSSLETVNLIRVYSEQVLQHRAILVAILVLISIISVFYNVDGHHQKYVEIFRSNLWFFVYWIGLGVLSSVGLGTGLHTFILYLAPHIAKVTLAAYECNSVNFPSPPYPDDIICPDTEDLQGSSYLWAIMSKVRLEAFLWGAGTALGELPPYFMARAARLSGYDPDDAEDIAEYEELKRKQTAGHLTIMDRGKLFMESIVQKIGFLGILACASIPNPLFDLAGITCGHFLVPFWTFFGATLIGKAVVKMHIQKIFVIVALNESYIDRAVNLLSFIPVIGKKLQKPFKSFLNNQKKHLHRQNDSQVENSGNILSKVFEFFVVGMICYFVISIVNSLAQNYHKRVHKKSQKKNK